MGFNNSHNLISKKTEYSRYYSNMGGVDFSGDGSGIDRSRFSYLENMYRDYDGEGAGLVESVVGFRILFRIGERIRRLYLQKSAAYGEYLLIVSESSLYRVRVDARDEPDALELLGEIPEGEVVGYPFGESFFLIAGGHLYSVSPTGQIQTVGFGEGELAPYVPSTYKNGTAYEQRNLLSSRFYESTVLVHPDAYASGSLGLLYEVNEEEDNTCTLIGRSDSSEGVLHIPSYVQIDEQLYTVTKIADNAFADDATLTEVHMSEGLLEIGYYAFARCPSLTRVMLSDSVTTVCGGAFVSCEALSTVHLGLDLEAIGSSVFDLCTSLTGVSLAMSEDTFLARFGSTVLSEYERVFNAQNHYLSMELPIHSTCSAILSFTKDSEAYAYTPIYDEAGHVRKVCFSCSDKRLMTNATIRIEGEYAKNGECGVFLPDEGSDEDAPLAATVCELFDGRIFLSGTSSYPNTVFYNARDSRGVANPTYFGVYNTFSDGVGSFRVNAMLSVANTLAVFKENDDGAGSIYYHTPQQTGESLVPKIYPVSYTHTGLVGRGGVISYYDEPIFVSESGICALSKAKINLERSVEVRSHRINARLLCEELANITLTKWCGYLVVCADGHLYLADYRQLSTHAAGSYEYEWYYLTGVGTYENDACVYRYSSVPSEGYAKGADDEIAEGEVYSEADESGATHYYVNNGEQKVEVYPTEERTGGTFCGANLVFCVRDLLFFATPTGDVCVFNNDKRGEPPEWQSLDDGEREEYKKYASRRIHKSYYSFAGHAPKYALYTKRDNCDIPHLSKDSVKGSLTLRCRTHGTGHAMLEVGTDHEGFVSALELQGGTLDFSEIDFSAFAMHGEDYLTLALGGRVKNFVEKQIGIYTDTFASPIAVSSLAYRYTVRGKIKNK